MQVTKPRRIVSSLRNPSRLRTRLDQLPELVPLDATGLESDDESIRYMVRDRATLRTFPRSSVNIVVSHLRY